MLLFHLLRFSSDINVHYAACCGCHFVILLIFTARLMLKKNLMQKVILSDGEVRIWKKVVMVF